MPAEFLERVPDDVIALESLERLQAGTYFDTATLVFDDGRDSGIREEGDHGGSSILFPVLRENSSVAVVWQGNSVVP